MKFHTVCNILLYLIMYYIALFKLSELMGHEETCDIAQSCEDDGFDLCAGKLAKALKWPLLHDTALTMASNLCFNCHKPLATVQGLCAHIQNMNGCCKAWEKRTNSAPVREYDTQDPDDHPCNDEPEAGWDAHDKEGMGQELEDYMMDLSPVAPETEHEK